jgi:hypothetical protein
MEKFMKEKYILDSKKRENLIIKIIDNDEPIMTGVKLPIVGIKELNVYRIPLNLTVYNHLNDRFASKRREHFKETGNDLNIDSEESLDLIGDFIWNSNETRNAETLNDIIKFKQQEFAVITRDGRIIDGNRRSRILRELFYSDENDYEQINKDEYGYINAVVLPNNIDDKEIQKLETILQMGKDEKVDYDPIEKYLKVDKLFDLGYEYKDISKMIKSFKNSANKAEEAHEVYKLMVNYLKKIDGDDVFSLVDKSEDLFLKLSNTLDKLKNDKFEVDWQPSEVDIEDLKTTSFNYIRAKYEGKDFRNLMGGPKDKSGIFSVKKVWDKFFSKHEPLIANVEKEIKSKSKSNQFKNLNERESFYIKSVKEKLETNMELGKEAINNTKRSSETKDLIEEALDKLNSINLEFFVENFDPKAYEALKQLIIKATEISELVKNNVFKQKK